MKHLNLTQAPDWTGEQLFEFLINLPSDTLLLMSTGCLTRDTSPREERMRTLLFSRTLASMFLDK
jgi:hypothetical protein